MYFAARMHNRDESTCSHLENWRAEGLGADGAVEHLHPHDSLPLWNALSLLETIPFPLVGGSCSLHRHQGLTLAAIRFVGLIVLYILLMEAALLIYRCGSGIKRALWLPSPRRYAWR